MPDKSQENLVGKRLAAMLSTARAKHGHTLRAAAAELDSSTESIRNWESGKRSPMKEKLPRIAAYLNLPAATVMKYWYQDQAVAGGEA